MEIHTGEYLNCLDVESFKSGVLDPSVPVFVEQSHVFTWSMSYVQVVIQRQVPCLVGFM